MRDRYVRFYRQQRSYFRVKKEHIIDEIKKYKRRVSNKRILFLRSSIGLVENFNLPCWTTKDTYIRRKMRYSRNEDETIIVRV